MNYQPGPVPEVAGLPAFLTSELRRISAALQDNAEAIFYRTLPVKIGSLSAGISANWRLTGGNVFLVSTSVTHTLTGLQRMANFGDGMQERVFINVGTGVLAFKSEGTESSASNRFTLASNWNISAGGAGVLWRDPIGARWRGIARTA